jgi:hypothetical protein
MKIENDDSIINWTPISIRDGELPYRIVVRKVEGCKPFACYYENMRLEASNKFVHESFYYGIYCDTEEQATNEFEERRNSFGR